MKNKIKKCSIVPESYGDGSEDARYSLFYKNTHIGMVYKTFKNGEITFSLYAIEKDEKYKSMLEEMFAIIVKPYMKACYEIKKDIFERALTLF